ncbi:MAG: PhzF family phenazine biosynthesis protein [Deltaproteobacteria bacterium]|nr:PhzF family phenazine biosynthesis protein [Deltaproteobacteria bacterium]
MTRLLQVDAFADGPFTGNPAAVAILEKPRDESWMQRVAQEMNLSETAFVLPAGSDWAIRWFTPTTEVALCGHATLASFHALREEGKVGDSVTFSSASGPLVARAVGDRVELDFPATPPERCDEPEGLLDALGLADAKHIARSRHDVLVEVGEQKELTDLYPDFRALSGVDARGVIVTAMADEGGEGLDFVSRFFAPRAGVDEDPVTGSAHCALAPYWSAKLGARPLRAKQLSRRSGRLEVELRGDRVALRGQAVTVLAGELRV